MITIEKTVISETEPQATNVGWFKPSTGELKYFSDGWKSTTPPVATAETLGGVKIGDGLSITQDGILNLKTPDNYYIILEYSNEEGLDVITVTYKIGDTVSRTEVWDIAHMTIKRYSGEYPTVVAPAAVYIIGYEEEFSYTLLNVTLPSWLHADEMGEMHLYNSPLQISVSVDFTSVMLSINVENGLLKVSEMTT